MDTEDSITSYNILWIPIVPQLDKCLKYMAFVKRTVIFIPPNSTEYILHIYPVVTLLLHVSFISAIWYALFDLAPFDVSRALLGK